MNKKTTGIIAYITVIGWLVAFFAGDKEGAKFHLNQALSLWIVQIVLNILSFVVGFVSVSVPVLALVWSLISAVVGIFIFVCWILGLIHAVKEEEKELPLIGKIQILK